MDFKWKNLYKQVPLHHPTLSPSLQASCSRYLSKSSLASMILFSTIMWLQHMSEEGLAMVVGRVYYNLAGKRKCGMERGVEHEIE